MKAAVFVEPGRIALQEKAIPAIGATDALLRLKTTTICGTDVHILKGKYPVARGLTVGREPVGVIEDLGAAVTGYRIGQRVIVKRAPRSLGSDVPERYYLRLLPPPPNAP
jgi:threonine dehydrogenase-like Zn-dependent dehydrogenase